MLQPFAVGFPLQALSGAELPPYCAFETRMKRRWLPSPEHLHNVAPNIPSFTRMKWISISTPKSVQTGNCEANKNAL